MRRVRALDRARRLTTAEWRLLARACVLQLTVRVLLVVWPLPRVAAWSAGRRRRPPAIVGPVDLERLARWSTRLCRGTCLTEGLTLCALAAREGIEVPVHVGVSGRGEAFRAHAWTGNAAANGFVRVWSSDERKRIQ